MRTVVDPAFRAQLVNRIMNAGVSQNQLAKDAHVSAGYLSEIVNGQKTPSGSVAKALDDALAAGGELAALAHPMLSDDDADLFAAAVTASSTVSLAAVESLAKVLAAQRDLDDSLGSAALLKPVTVQLGQISRMVDGVRGPGRPSLVRVAGEWAQFAGWLFASAGKYDDANRWLKTSLLWANEAGDRDLVATVMSYEAHVAWLQTKVAPMIGLAEAALRDEAVFPAQRCYDALQAARGHAIYGNLAEVDRLLGLAERLADEARTWAGETPDWQYQRAQWTWDVERGIVLRHAAHHDPSRASAAVASLRAGTEGVPAEWQGAEWYAEYVVHLANALIDAGELDAAGVELARARLIAESVSSPRVLDLVTGRERRLRNHRLLAV